jgi:hypothetical protein
MHTRDRAKKLHCKICNGLQNAGLNIAISSAIKIKISKVKIQQTILSTELAKFPGEDSELCEKVEVGALKNRLLRTFGLRGDGPSTELIILKTFKGPEEGEKN